MTLLSAVQEAAPSIAIGWPDQVFGSSTPDMLAMRPVIRETVQQIIDANEWSSLQKFDQFTGDGVAATFTLPTDYDRMAKNSQIWCTDLPQGPLEQVGSLDDWMAMEVQSIEPFYRRWLLQGRNVTFSPVIPDQALARYAYYSRNIVKDKDGVAKESFTADDDTFVLPERLLTLGIIWNWKSRKGVDYTEEMATFQDALAREVTRDQGPGKIITSRRWGKYVLPPYGYPR